MRGWRYLLSCLAGIGALTLVAPAAMASSAGDQQYVDPLASSTTQTSTNPPPSQSSSPPAQSPAPAQTSAPAAPSESPSPASSPGSSAQSSSSASSTPVATATPRDSTTSSTSTVPVGQSTGATLPFTGLNVWLCAAIGLVLVAAGWAVRRLARSV